MSLAFKFGAQLLHFYMLFCLEIILFDRLKLFPISYYFFYYYFDFNSSLPTAFF